MSTYTAPQRTPRKRRLSNRARVLLIASLLVPASLLAIARTPVNAAPSSNPIFATIQDVQNAINAALAPIQNAIADLQSQQANQATQISNLQNSSSKSLKVYDANGNELGALVNHDGYADIIYSSSLKKFVYIADNEYEESTGDNSNTSDTNGIANKINPLYYQSSDCTGTPYWTSYNFNANNVMSFSPTEYYVFHTSEPFARFTVESFRYWNTATKSSSCVVGASSDFQGWQLYPVTLPFSTPIAQPLQFKYQ